MSEHKIKYHIVILVFHEHMLLKSTVMANDDEEMDICSSQAVSMCTMARSIIYEYASSKSHVRYAMANCITVIDLLHIIKNTANT